MNFRTCALRTLRLLRETAISRLSSIDHNNAQCYIKQGSKNQKEHANLKKIQAPSTVQPRTPQLQRSSYSDIQAFSDKNLGYNDTTGQEIILRTLAMGKSDSNEFSYLKILQYSTKYMQPMDTILTSSDPAQRHDFKHLALLWFIDGLQLPTFRQHVLTQDVKSKITAVFLASRYTN